MYQSFQQMASTMWYLVNLFRMKNSTTKIQTISYYHWIGISIVFSSNLHWICLIELIFVAHQHQFAFISPNFQPTSSFDYAGRFPNVIDECVNSKICCIVKHSFEQWIWLQLENWMDIKKKVIKKCYFLFFVTKTICCPLFCSSTITASSPDNFNDYEKKKKYEKNHVHLSKKSNFGEKHLNIWNNQITTCCSNSSSIPPFCSVFFY